MALINEIEMQQECQAHVSSEHVPHCIAGRYVLRSVIGRGGHGEVWEADDTLTQTLVAVKLLRSDVGVEPARVRREVSALRLLRIPGVVQMLDEGIDGGRPFLVMERISGSPFPGTPEKTWSSIAGPTLALLETLDRVHTAGVVHRDIKPGNVLVDEHGRPTLLDFGLSLGPSLARDSASDDHILGTPDYLAPEQIVGDTITPATDLYAIGVMLYEALSGRLPHEADDFQTLMRLRLTEPSPRLSDIAPDVPVAITNTIDSLLVRAPKERPQSARDLIDRLRDRTARAIPSIEVVSLEPWPEARLRELFIGPDRIFHLCEDAAQELYARSQGLPSRIWGELAAWERAGLAQKVGPKWMVSREALDRLAAGRVALPLPPVVSTEAARAPVPQHLEELAIWVELSWPHTNIEDLSRITDRPQSGIEADMEELVECGAVVRLADGRAMAQGRAARLSRRNTERRRSAHRAIAKALPRGAEGRLFHLIASQSEREATDPSEIVAETLALAEPLVLQGRLGRATALLSDGLLAARQGAAQNIDWGESRLLGWLVELAIADGSPRALDAVLYELCRVTNATAETEALERLVRAALAMRTTGGDRAISLVDSIAPFSNPDLERTRQQVRVHSARRCSLEQEQSVLEEAERWARDAGERAQTRFSGWLGRLRYREGRFDEAAELHAKAAVGEPWTTERVASHLNCASALIEAFRFDEAVVVADEARRLSAECRHAYCEARAEWLTRTARYRRGDSLDVDEEFVELAAKTGVVDLEALASLTEAAIAWRCGDMERMVVLARRTEQRWTAMSNTWGALFARTLAIAAIGATPEEWHALADAALKIPVPGAGVQMLGLLCKCRPDASVELLPAMLELRSSIPEYFWRFRMDVMSVDEAWGFVAERSV
ncbi:MAG: serine/threonine protein kinase [Polyangiaceae bacterium]|nr:serine/threonine protein kinase [Polyangiaceae bacterium]